MTITLRKASHLLTSGEGSIWIPFETEGIVQRIDGQTGEVIAEIENAAADMEAGGDITAGGGFVWAITRGSILERGRNVSIIGGCHDCHTMGYREAEGQIDPQAALKGHNVGFQGPWGTTYPLNLRITAATLHEDGFLKYIRRLRTLPPMPWYNLRALSDEDVRSLYRYIRSLGEPGEQAPTMAGPGEKPKAAFIVLDPPQIPSCTRDLDCGVGQVCGEGPVRTCVRR